MIDRKSGLDKSYLSTLSPVDRVDVICDFFEEQLIAGENPKIEDLLTLAPARDELLRELLAVEVEVKRNAGDTVSITDAQNRFPNDTAIVADVFANHHEPVDAVKFPLEIDHFVLEELVGQGSFGNVYRARDTKLNRIVAIKLASGEAPKNSVKRMLREAQSAAQLTHPGIVSVHAIGTSNYGPYIVMEYVRGETLRKRMERAGRMAYPTIAKLMTQVARAIHFAHENGVIHRDLKPANIMIPDADDQDSQASEHAQVLDFGLARHQFVDKTLTHSGQILGTPNYMSPEQAIGEGHGVSAISDIYSLGVILFELLSGQLPFDGDLPSLLRRIIEEPARSPRQLKRDVPRDLAVICLKCLEKETQHRYTSANELANDLQRWLQNRPIHARPQSKIRRLKSWVQRRKALAASLIFCTFVGTIAGITQYTMSENEKARLLVNELLAQPPEGVVTAIRNVRESQRARKGLADFTGHRGITATTAYRGALTLFPYEKDRIETLIKNLPRIGIPEFLATVAETELAAKSLSKAFWQDLDTDSFTEESLLKMAYLCRYSDTRKLDESMHRLAKTILKSEQKVEELVDLFAPIHGHLDSSLGKLLVLVPSIEEKKRAAEFIVRSMTDGRSLFEHICNSERGTFSIFMDAIRDDPKLAIQLLEAELSRHTDVATETEMRNRAKLVVALLDVCGSHNVELSQFVKTAPDPRIQTYLIDLPSQLDVPVHRITKQLRQQEHNDVLYALVLSLGNYQLDDFMPRERQEAVAWLIDSYREHPDPGVHAAILSTLKTWGLTKQIEEIDAQLIIEGINQKRNWYLNSLGQGFAILPFSIPFPDTVTDSGKTKFGLAVAMTETTRAEYYEIMDKTIRVPPNELNLPIDGLTYFDALEYCSRLNQREKLPNGIRISRGTEGDQNFIESKTDLTACGYRLPCIREWQYYCDAGVADRFPTFFGNLKTIKSDRYGPYDKDGKLFPVAEYRPNQFGLFDITRNVSEWSVNRHADQRAENGFNFVQELTVFKRLNIRTKARQSNLGQVLGGSSVTYEPWFQHANLATLIGPNSLLSKGEGIRVCRPIRF